MRVALSGEAGVAERLLRRVRPSPRSGRGSSRPRSRARARRARGRRGPPPARAAAAPSARAARARRRPDRPRRTSGGRRRRRGRALARLVAGRPRPLGGGVGDRGGLRAVPTEERCGEVELEHDVEARRPGQLERPLEQPGGGPVVAPPERAAAGGREPLAGAFGQGRVGLSELLLVAGGLLEVVAEDLVQLDQLLSALLEPVGEALVQLRPGRLRERVVGGVADQQVAEAEAVLAARTAPCRDGSAPGGRARPGAASPASPPVRAPARRRGGRPRPRPRRARAPAARPRRAGRGGRRAAPAASAAPRPRLPPRRLIASISAMKSGLPPAAAAILARSSSGTAVADQAGRVLAAERLEPHRHRPGGAALEQLRAGDADEQERGAAGEQRHDARPGRGTSPHPTGCRRRATTSGACSSSSLRNAQAISSADVPASDSPEQRADRRRGGRIGGQSRRAASRTSTTGQ